MPCTSINGVTNALTFKVGSASTWNQNGVLKDTGNYKSESGVYPAAPWVGTSADYQVIFGAAVDTVGTEGGRGFEGKVKAIRIYDRVLSADELAANAMTDDARYGQQLTGSNIPEGYAENGLVLFLDGLDNTGTGDHSTSAMKWINLADRSEYATFPSVFSPPRI